MANIQKIPFAYLRENELNLFRENENQEAIDILAENIAESGLNQPLVVYLKTKEPKPEYVILSGHKRYQALKRLGRVGMVEVDCVIRPKPADENREVEALLGNNICRQTPEELKMQVKAAEHIYLTMPAAQRKTFVEDARAKYKEKYKNDPAMLKEFRPKIAYIRHYTGLTVTNKTVTNLLKDSVKETAEAFETEETKANKVRDITIKDIINKATALAGLIDNYKNGSNVTENESKILTDLLPTIRIAVDNLKK